MNFYQSQSLFELFVHSCTPSDIVVMILMKMMMKMRTLTVMKMRRMMTGARRLSCS